MKYTGASRAVGRAPQREVHPHLERGAGSARKSPGPDGVHAQCSSMGHAPRHQFALRRGWQSGPGSIRGGDIGRGGNGRRVGRLAELVGVEAGDVEGPTAGHELLAEGSTGGPAVSGTAPPLQGAAGARNQGGAVLGTAVTAPPPCHCFLTPHQPPHHPACLTLCMLSGPGMTHLHLRACHDAKERIVCSGDSLPATWPVDMIQNQNWNQYHKEGGQQIDHSYGCDLPC